MNRYVLAGAVALATGAAVVGGLVGGSGDVAIRKPPKARPVDPGNLRPAVVDCSAITDENTQTMCPGGVARRGAGRCLCLTDSQNAIDGELQPGDIPPARRKRKVLRCGAGEHGEHLVRTEPVTTPPARAIILVPNILDDTTMHGIQSDLTRAVVAKCCASCPDACNVRPGDWGQCPYCLCDDSCKTSCCGTTEGVQ